MKQLIERMAKALVDNPEQVQVSEMEPDNTLVLELNVAKEDVGKVIGKQGRTVQATRTILTCASGKSDKHVNLEIIEE